MLQLKLIKGKNIGGKSVIKLDSGEVVAEHYTTFRILRQSRILIGTLLCEEMVPFADFHQDLRKFGTQG